MKKPFKDWTITFYTATSPDMKYQLWIASGFLGFSDSDEAKEHLLSVVGIWHRWRLWRELKKEMISRIDKILL